MDQKIKTKWIEALRSGKYAQGVGSLKTIDDENVVRFCCLGVLCDVVDPEYREKIEYRWRNQDILSYRIINEVCLTREQEEVLVALNDDAEASFDEIADYIEKEL